MKALITGGAGFIGTNAAARLIKDQHQVIIVDNLSRPGVQHNLDYLKTCGLYKFHKLDLTNVQELKSLIRQHPDLDLVLHLAGQTAVTKSVKNPRQDLQDNLIATFNLLEAVRQSDADPVIIYASTNKVYGSLDAIPTHLNHDRYEFTNLPQGITEDTPLDFHSPYGCSKGAAEQYLLDYHRIYGLKTISFRQSCIYGTHQFGIEDQGWVAWFCLSSVMDKSINIFGDGYQSRDILWVDDLVNAYLAAYEHASTCTGHAYNIGGGTTNQLSLLQLITYIQTISGKTTDINYSQVRPGDQKVVVFDTSKASQDFGWQPTTSWQTGVAKLYIWMLQNQDTLQDFLKNLNQPQANPQRHHQHNGSYIPQTLTPKT